jgi:hypothetical protein
MRAPPLRPMIVAYWLCALASIALALAPAPLTGELAAAYAVAAADEGWFTADSTIAVLAIAMGSFLLLAVHVVGSIGLFLRRRWGRTLMSTSTVALFMAIPFAGVDVGWGLESFFGELNTLLLGAILAVAYFTPSVEPADPAPTA